jgi:hypothetical protein
VTWEITQADRAGWQRQAARELAAILDDCDDLPLIAWTVGPSGGGLSGRVTGPVPAAGVRGVFTAWQQALGMDDVLEMAVASGTWLRARARRGGVRVTLTVTVPAGDGDEEVTS